MTTPDMPTLLEDAADRIADISRADLQILLRRAALMLRNSGSIAFDHNMEEAVRDLAGEFGKTRNDTVRFIVREWMEQNRRRRRSRWGSLIEQRPCSALDWPVLRGRLCV